MRKVQPETRHTVNATYCTVGEFVEAFNIRRVQDFREKKPQKRQNLSPNSIDSCGKMWYTATLCISTEGCLVIRGHG